MIIGTTLIMLLALNGCASKSQAETIPSTIAATTEETTTPVAKTIPEETATLEEITKLNLPTLSTGRQFTEEEAMAYEAVYGNWEAQSDENKVVLGRESLVELVQSALLDFTEQEVNEVTDFILTQLPIPEVLETQPSGTEETTSVTEESLSGVESKPAQSKPVQSKPVQSKPVTQPTQSKPVVNEPVQQPTESQLTPEEQAELDELNRLIQERGKNQVVNDVGANGGHAGKPLEGEINISGGY